MKTSKIKYLCVALLITGAVASTSGIITNEGSSVRVAQAATNTYTSNVDLYYKGQAYTKRALFTNPATVDYSSTDLANVTLTLSSLAKTSLASIDINGSKYYPNNGKLVLPLKTDGSFSDVTVNISVVGLINESQPMQLRIASPKTETTTGGNTSNGSAFDKEFGYSYDPINQSVTTNSQIATLYDDSYNVVKNRLLAGNSSWYTDRTRTDSTGTRYYRVATHEWVKASSLI
ncbi:MULTISPECIES: hypothetical protein [Lactobacillaceae]|uniref:hypothetical protein n=1 Tax=Lactobacillaceae TaxID=33958 RepID=UPI000C1B77DB|nr:MULTISPECIES: hypothetical protein [Lactobacillaceae]